VSTDNDPVVVTAIYVRRDEALLAEFDAFAAARVGKPASRGMLLALRLRAALDPQS
jgi:hypothetical protein